MMPRVVPRTPAKITAVKPTMIETRAPNMSRERTSRPRWSVPRRWSAVPPACHAGGRNRSPSTPTSGLWGARTLAKIAISTDVRMITHGMSGNPSVRKAARRPARFRVADTGRLCAALPFISDPRVDDRIEDVNQEIGDHDHGAAHQDVRLNDGEVAEGDALEEQTADARPGEDRLHDDRRVDHDHEIDPGQRDDRNQRVLERVLGDDERLRQPLEPRELHVFRTQNLEHRRAREAHVGGGEYA